MDAVNRLNFKGQLMSAGPNTKFDVRLATRYHSLEIHSMNVMQKGGCPRDRTPVLERTQIAYGVTFSRFL